MKTQNSKLKIKKPITDEIATIGNDITRYYIGKVQINPDKVLSSEATGEGLQLYEDIERDAHLYSVMQTRKLSVVGKEWSIEPASDDARDIEIAEFVEQNFKEINFDRACEELLDGLLKGFKPSEIMWDYSEGQIQIKEFRGRDPRRFTFGLENDLRLLTWADMIYGEEIPDRKFQLFRFGSKNNNPFGTGLGQKCYWPVWFKKNGIKFWMIFSEKFGMPTIVGKYPSGTEKDKQDNLLDACKAIQTDTAIKIPENMEIALLEATRATSINTYETLCTFMDLQISKAVLGQTLTTEIGDKGSYAASQTHEEVRQDILKSDSDSLCEYLNNQSIKWLVDYNFPDIKKYPKIWKRTEPEKDLKPLAERDVILIRDLKLPTATKYLYDTYGIPAPEEGEELITIPQSSGFPPLGFSEKTGGRG